MFSSYKGIFGKYCFHVKAPLKTVSMLYFSMFAYTGNIVFFSVLRWHKLNKYCIFYIYINKSFILLYGMASFMCSSDKTALTFKKYLCTENDAFMCLNVFC